MPTLLLIMEYAEGDVKPLDDKLKTEEKKREDTRGDAAMVDKAREQKGYIEEVQKMEMETHTEDSEDKNVSKMRTTAGEKKEYNSRLNKVIKLKEQSNLLGTTAHESW